TGSHGTDDSTSAPAFSSRMTTASVDRAVFRVATISPSTAQPTTAACRIHSRAPVRSRSKRRPPCSPLVGATGCPACAASISASHSRWICLHRYPENNTGPPWLGLRKFPAGYLPPREQLSVVSAEHRRPGQEG